MLLANLPLRPLALGALVAPHSLTFLLPLRPLLPQLFCRLCFFTFPQVWIWLLSSTLSPRDLHTSGHLASTPTWIPYRCVEATVFNSKPPSQMFKPEARSQPLSLCQWVTKSRDFDLLHLWQSGHLFPPCCQQPGPSLHHFLPGLLWQLPRCHPTSMLITFQPTLHTSPRNLPKTEI